MGFANSKQIKREPCFSMQIGLKSHKTGNKEVQGGDRHKQEGHCSNAWS